MFHFFPGNYMWSQAMLRVLFTGGNPGDVVHIASQLAGAPAANADVEAWYAVWKRSADRVWTRAENQAAADHKLSARDNYLRACAYDQWSVSFLNHADPRRHAAHRRSVEAFAGWGKLIEPAAEYVEVPYLGGSFPAWYLPGQPRSVDTTKAAVVYLPGWDSTKEQGVGIALALAERGIGTLLCDGPGVGEAVLFRGLVNRHDYEVPGAAAVDYLLSRADLKPLQVGVVGSSLGGYRAARMAAYESRLAGAVVWGAVWDFKRTWEGRRRVGTGVLPTPDEHALHVMGAKDADEVSRLMDTWNLEGVAKRIHCPLLILHGQQDTQIRVEDAMRLYREAGSSAKELKIFAPEETGAAHCQNDNRVVAHEYIGDYLVDVLLRGQTRQGIVRGAAACA